MTSETVAARVEPLVREGDGDQPRVGTRDADTAFGGDADRPTTSDGCDPLPELGASADREGAQ